MCSGNEHLAFLTQKSPISPITRLSLLDVLCEEPYVKMCKIVCVMCGWELTGTEHCLAPRVPICKSFMGGK
jgi:hypothetical protein